VLGRVKRVGQKAHGLVPWQVGPGQWMMASGGVLLLPEGGCCDT